MNNRFLLASLLALSALSGCVSADGNCRDPNKRVVGGECVCRDPGDCNKKGGDHSPSSPGSDSPSPSPEPMGKP